MHPDKIAILKALTGLTDEEIDDLVLTPAERLQAKADADGVRFKADGVRFKVDAASPPAEPQTVAEAWAAFLASLTPAQQQPHVDILSEVEALLQQQQEGAR